MSEITREEVDAMSGAVVLEFGTSWCPHCRAIQPVMADTLANYPQVRHLKIEDGPGRRLGRSFQVKLWPTLVFMIDGTITSHLVRPSSEQIAKAFAELATRDEN